MSLKIGNGLDLASQKIQHMADGSASDDAATYGQLINLLNGRDWHQHVRVVSVANLTVASPGATINGVTMVAGDRVLLAVQTTGSENGPYVWNGAAVPMTRAADGVTGELNADATFYAAEGTTFPDSAWTLTTNDPIVVGTTALVFVQSGGFSPDTAGNGLQKAGSVFSVKLPASSGLVADGTGTYIDTAIVVRKFAALIGDGSSTSLVVTHNLGTRDVEVMIYDAASFAKIITDVVMTTTNTITVTFAVAPASNAYRVVVQA